MSRGVTFHVVRRYIQRSSKFDDIRHVLTTFDYMDDAGFIIALKRSSKEGDRAVRIIEHDMRKVIRFSKVLGSGLFPFDDGRLIIKNGRAITFQKRKG